jgi:site-specific DNA-methyltransferase (adenine-specific)
MPQLDCVFDAVICDLPYQVTVAAWDIIIPFEPLWFNYNRLGKANAAKVLFGKQPFATLLAASNMNQFRYEWIWEKSNGGEFLNANRKPLPRHENILVFYDKLPTYNPQMSKGTPYACTSAGVGVTTADLSVIGWRTVNEGERYPTSVLKFANDTGLHNTQKPLKLLEYLVKTYTNQGDLVLDNCIGSGTTLLAAQNEGRQAVGIEISEEYCEIAIDRLRQPSFFSIPDKPKGKQPKQGALI